MTALAFEAEVIPLRPDLMGAAVKYFSGDIDKAEDLVQDVMVKALMAWDRFDASLGGLRRWLMTILRNTFIDRYNRSKRGYQVHDEIAGQIEHVGPEVALMADSAPAPADEAIDRAQAKEDVHAALCQLSDPYRAAVTLRDIEGHSYKEIAEIEGCAVGTVMSRIHRGRKKLREILSLDRETETSVKQPTKPRASQVSTVPQSVEEPEQLELEGLGAPDETGDEVDEVGTGRGRETGLVRVARVFGRWTNAVRSAFREHDWTPRAEPWKRQGARPVAQSSDGPEFGREIEEKAQDRTQTPMDGDSHPGSSPSIEAHVRGPPRDSVHGLRPDAREP